MVICTATVLRASIMAALALVARSFSRIYSVLRALFVAGIVMLIYNPFLLVFDVGFQLSFMATLGLILVAPYLESSLSKVPATIGIREFLVATLATQLFVLPILLYQIGEFSLVSVIVNVLVLPMVPVAMLLTFITGMAGLISSSLTVLPAWVSYTALSYNVAMPTWFAALPFAAFTVPAFSFLLVPVMYGVIAYGLYRYTRPADPLKDWVIEEDTSDELPQSADEKSTTAPVFFR